MLPIHYEIIATLGPGSDTESIWRALLSAGATAFRLNTSHLSLDELAGWLERLEALLARVHPRPPLVLDLQGSKWRLGQFSAFELVPGQAVELIYAASTERPNALPVPHPDFFQAAPVSNGEIVLNDAKIGLAMETAGADALVARVTRGGQILPRKGITFTASDYRRETLDEKDQAIVERTRSYERIRYAISYVRDAVEMARYRAHAGRSAYVIAKLERRPAIDEAMQIAQSADEVWLCRGDLGAELGAQAMAEAVYQFSEQVRNFPAPVLLAGQVLEHLTEHATPTRSEVCYLHDALVKGYRGVVLSDETALGRDPAASCRVAAMFRECAEGLDPKSEIGDPKFHSAAYGGQHDHDG